MDPLFSQGGHGALEARLVLLLVVQSITIPKPNILKRMQQKAYDWRDKTLDVKISCLV